MSDVIVLPEITIVGDPNALPTNAIDWWSDGFVAGYNAPEATLDRPLMINDELAGSYFAGVASGQQAARDAMAEFEAQFADQPQVQMDLKGESLEKAQQRLDEALRELFHEHMPHIENDTEMPVPTPGLRLAE